MNNYFKYFQYIDSKSLYYTLSKVEDSSEYFVNYDESKWITNFKDNTWKTYLPKDEKLPMQGWKIHISARLDNAKKTLDTIAPLLLQQRIPFKHVKNKNVLISMYSKNGSRISAGKFITIYPGSEAKFVEILYSLYEIIKEFPDGPYILTDKQVGKSNLYFRYGAYQEIKSSNNELCIYDDKDELIPDLREPYYSLPEFIKEPEILTKLLNQIDHEEINPVSKDNQLNEYEIIEVIRYSNSGGIYKARRKNDGIQCIIKEARPNIGYDGQLRSAPERLEGEYKSLCKLEDVDGVVNPLAYFKVWKHNFMVEEFISGQTLANWIATNYPFSQKDNNIQLYTKAVIKMVNSLYEILVNIHKKGLAMVDLQTQNIMVDADKNVTLIDFELAREVLDNEPVGMETKGFVHKLCKNAEERDWYALSRIIQYCVLPIGPVADIDSNLNERHYLWIRDNFGEEFFKIFVMLQIKVCSNIKESCQIFNNGFINKKEIELRHRYKDKISDLEKLREKLINGVLSNCNAQSDSLINGDIRQFELDCGKFNILTGGFGAIMALERSDYSIIEKTPALREWIEISIPSVLESNFNNGLFTGKMGIAIVLYECNYYEAAEQLIDQVIESLDYASQDVSLRSGLSGIGLALITLFSNENKGQYLKTAEKIADEIIEKFVNKISFLTTDWDSLENGLLDGYAGVAVFLAILYKVTCKKKYIDYAQCFLSEDIKKMKFIEGDGSFQIFDSQKNRFLPYLANGSLGVDIAIHIINAMGKTKVYQEEYRAIKEVNRFRCCYDAGLFDGASGFFLLNCLDNDMSSLLSSLERLSLFVIEDRDKILIPGKYSYKLSSDLYSGGAGTLLAVLSVRERNIFKWLPILNCKYM